MVVRSLLAIIVVLGVLVACGGGDAGDDASTGSTDMPNSSGAAGDAEADRDDSPAQLSIGSGFLPATLDPAADGFGLIQFGLGETLTRILPDQQVEPWLATSVTSDDMQRWEIELREDAVFWDGTPVDAAAVERSLQRSLDSVPAATQFIDPAMEIRTIDERTLELTFAEPVPTLPNSLASFQFIIAIEDAEAPGRYQMTGPYRPAEHTPEDRMRLVANSSHWDGEPPFDEVTVRLIGDANARMLGLQSGELDIVTEVPPELAAGVGGEVEIVSAPSTRVHYVVLNHTHPPFDDPAVREAFSLGIDRDTLNTVSLAGLGTPMSTVFPPNVGLPTIEDLETDLGVAGDTLDAAGWLMNDNGVREKDGTPLSLVLYTYARRPELPVIAVSIQDQLRDLGFEIEIRQVEDIVAQLDSGDFDASIFSVNLVPIGDPQYVFSMTLVDSGTYYYGGYHDDRLEEITKTLQTEDDADEREALILEAQEIVRADTVNVYLLAAPRIVAYRTDRLEPFTVHTNDLYVIDPSIRPR